MKSIVAILFLSIILFKWIGYRFVSDYFENKAIRAMQAKIDENNYSDADLISFKIPFQISYGTYSTEFVRIDGNIYINGVCYQYVKRRFYNDTLELLCMPNVIKSKVVNARNEFFRLANDYITYNSSKKPASNSHHSSVKYSFQDITDKNYFDIDISSFTKRLAFRLMNFEMYSLLYIFNRIKPPLIV